MVTEPSLKPKGKKKEKAFTVRSTTTFENVSFMPDFQSKYGIRWQGAYDNIENTNWGPRFDGQPRQVDLFF
jgi:hypothetical protein